MSNVSDNLLIDIEFGIRPSANGDLEKISGIENLKQALFNRLITVKGSLTHRPNYGVGIQLWQGAANSIDNQRQIADEIKNQFEEDDRVSSVLGVRIVPNQLNPSIFSITYSVEVVGAGQFSETVDPFGDSI